MNLGDVLNKVWEIKSLENKPGQKEATKILERIAKQVQPIMQKHKWQVKLLSEFCPKDPYLLGLNVDAGDHVQLRLRMVNRDWDFIPYDEVLDMMLHELCHNVYDPHSVSFYKLWDELRKECEELMGRRLGEFARQAPISSLRQTASAAAEQKRARLGSLLPSGPIRLGGDSTFMVSLSPTQAAAMAAEGRFQDEMCCDPPDHTIYVEKSPANTVNHGSNNKAKSESSSSFESSNGNKSGINFAYLTNESSDFDGGSRKRSRKFDNDVASQSFDSRPKSSSADLSNHPPFQHAPDPVSTDASEECVMWEWECATCTLLNPPLASLCKLCETQRPEDADTKYKNWFCIFCTLENSVKLDKCLACEQWRSYSYDPPASSRGPNLGA